MQDEIKVLVIEDEEIWASLMADTLTECGYTHAGTATSFEAALHLLGTAVYDLAVVDINLNGRNSGIELGKLIGTLYRKPFIFVTASLDKQTIADAAAARPSAYLPKPAHQGAILIAIQSAINNFQQQTPANATVGILPETDFIFVKQGNRYRKIMWADVVSLRSDKNYTALYNASDKTEYFIRSTLPNTLAEIIPSAMQQQFIQLNRAEVVQYRYITEVTGDEAVTAYRTFTVSSSHFRQLKEKLNLIS